MGLHRGKKSVRWGESSYRLVSLDGWHFDLTESQYNRIRPVIDMLRSTGSLDSDDACNDRW
ncbi:hypothetical protein PHISCL_11281, partial [Aspergillus sclerotialis]